MGVDLSTRATAALIVPLNWGGDWLLTRTLVVGAKLDKTADDLARAQRTEMIADRLIRFAVDYRVGCAWFEGYAFGKNTMAHTLGELGGVVRLEFVRRGIAIRTSNMSTARKLLLGKTPPGKGAAKHAAYKTLRAAGMPLRSEKETWLDEIDAFVACNLGLSEAGAYCFAQTPVPVRRSRG